MTRPPSNLQDRAARDAIRTLFSAALCFTALVLRAESAHAEPATSHDREAARQKIAAMTESERTRLKSDFEKFRLLPANEQDKLRQLDRELQKDADLQRTMKEYLDFLEPLSPGEREDLHRESAPDRRAALVRTMMKEQQDRAESWTRRGASRRGLGSADLDAVLGVVETHLRKQKLRTPQQLNELDEKKGLARQVAILELAFARPTVGDRGLPPLVAPSQPMLEEMVSAISDLELRQRAIKGGSPERIRNNLIGLIYAGVWAGIESVKPTEEVLVEFFAKLSGVEQGEILRLPVDQQPRALLRKYAETHPDQIPKMPAFPRWVFGGDRGGRRGGGRPSDGDLLRGPDRTEPGPDGKSGASPDRRRERPNGKPKSDKPSS